MGITEIQLQGILSVPYYLVSLFSIYVAIYLEIYEN